jgi:hypothetical protein
MERPLSSALGHTGAVKVQGIDNWAHLSGVRHATEESTSGQAQPGDTYSHEPLENVKLIIWKS